MGILTGSSWLGSLPLIMLDAGDQRTRSRRCIPSRRGVETVMDVRSRSWYFWGSTKLSASKLTLGKGYGMNKRRDGRALSHPTWVEIHQLAAELIVRDSESLGAMVKALGFHRSVIYK